MRHFLFNDKDDLVKKFAFFDKEDIRATIVNYLTANPKQQLTHEKELSAKDKKKFAGNDVINVYGCNRKGVPSLLIFKGDKTYYKTLQN